MTTAAITTTSQVPRPRDSLWRSLVTSAVVARAACQIFGNHVSQAVGRRNVWALAAIVAAAIIGMNALVYGFYSEFLPEIFDPARAGADSSSAVVAARIALVQAQAISSAAVGLIVLVVSPARSGLTITARISGARRGAILVGETVPVLATIVILVVLCGCGACWFMAQRQQLAPIVFAGLLAYSVLCAAVMLAANQVAVFVARLCRFSAQVCRMCGALLGFGLVSALVIDLMRSTLGGELSVSATLSRELWGGRALPGDVASAGLTVLSAAVLILVYLAVVALSSPLTVLEHDPVIVALGRARHPELLVNFVLREAVLLARHPVSQLSLLSGAVLSALVVLGVGTQYLPAPLGFASLALLFGSVAETTVGRSLPSNWITVGARFPVWRRVAAQYIGGLAVPGLLLLAATGALLVITGSAGSNDAASSAAAMAVVVLRTLLTFASLSSAAYLGGAVVPYSRAAPAGMVLTSAVSLCGEAVVLYAATSLVDPDSIASAVIEGASVLVALAAASLITRKRDLALH
ncbi:hypothetical protein BH09ACT6_BH09ACT6_17640 [soil metagenome]